MVPGHLSDFAGLQVQQDHPTLLTIGHVVVSVTNCILHQQLSCTGQCRQDGAAQLVGMPCI